MIGLLRSSFTAQIVALALIAFVALKGNNAYQQWKGASDLSAKIEKKADANVKNADAVRDAVASGARGVRNPYLRSP